MNINTLPHSKDLGVGHDHFSLTAEGDIGIVRVFAQFSQLGPQEGALHFYPKPNYICNVIKATNLNKLTSVTCLGFKVTNQSWRKV